MRFLQRECSGPEGRMILSRLFRGLKAPAPSAGAKAPILVAVFTARLKSGPFKASGPEGRGITGAFFVGLKPHAPSVLLVRGPVH